MPAKRNPPRLCCGDCIHGQPLADGALICLANSTSKDIILIESYDPICPLYDHYEDEDLLGELGKDIANSQKKKVQQ